MLPNQTTRENLNPQLPGGIKRVQTDFSIAKQESLRSKLIKFLNESFCKYVRGGH